MNTAIPDIRLARLDRARRRLLAGANDALLERAAELTQPERVLLVLLIEVGAAAPSDLYREDVRAAVIEAVARLFRVPRTGRHIRPFELDEDIE